MPSNDSVVPSSEESGQQSMIFRVSVSNRTGSTVRAIWKKARTGAVSGIVAPRRPSWPHAFEPQLRTPKASRVACTCPPATTLTTSSRPRTVTGVVAIAGPSSPSPSAPSRDRGPGAFHGSSSSPAHVKPSPQAIDSAPRTPTTGVGVVRSLVEPSPSWPLSFAPQQRTVLSDGWTRCNLKVVESPRRRSARALRSVSFGRSCRRARAARDRCRPSRTRGRPRRGGTRGDHPVRRAGPQRARPSPGPRRAGTTARCLRCRAGRGRFGPSKTRARASYACMCGRGGIKHLNRREAWDPDVGGSEHIRRASVTNLAVAVCAPAGQLGPACEHTRIDQSLTESSRHMRSWLLASCARRSSRPRAVRDRCGRRGAATRADDARVLPPGRDGLPNPR